MKTTIKNYENYELYDTGDVINTTTGKKLQGSVRLNGYKVYRLSKNNQKVEFYAHRLVAEYFIPNPENLPVVNHKDGNKLNNTVDNLEWTTYSENCVHAHQTGLVGARRKAEYYTENLPNEIWTPVPEYDKYLVSDHGRIRNSETNLLLKPSEVCGYLKVRLSKNGIVSDFLVHKLVYTTFIEDEIPENHVIDHIDGNKLNNCANNLRSVSNSENVLAALYTTKTNHSTKPVAQYEKNGNLLNVFPSTRVAAKELNLDSSTISKVCRGINKSHGGFVFHYLSSEEFKSFNDYPEIATEE